MPGESYVISASIRGSTGPVTGPEGGAVDCGRQPASQPSPQRVERVKEASWHGRVRRVGELASSPRGQ